MASAFVLILLSMWAVTIWLLSDKMTRRKLSAQLDEPNYTQLYTTLSRGAVKGVWKQLCDPVSHRGRWWPVLRAALTWRLYDRALLFAVVYPLLLIVAQWVVTGFGARVGSFALLPEALFWPARVMALLAIVVVTVATIHNRRVDASRMANSQVSLVILAVFAVSITIAGFSRTPFAMMLVGPFGSVLIAAFFFASALAAALILATIHAIAPLIVGAFAGAFAFSTAFALSVIVALAATLIGSKILVGAMIVTGAVALAAVFALGRLDMHGKQRLARVLLTLVLLAGLLILAMVFNWEAVPEVYRILFLFMAVLPVFNALFDVMSFAFTLSLVRLGMASPRPWLWGLADLGLACILFLALGATLVLVVHVLNLLAGVPFIDLQALFGGIHDRPSDYIWLYLTLFSTILPTSLHAVIALISLQGWCPRYFRSRLSDWIANSPQSPLYAIGASLGLGLLWAVPVAGALCVIWLVVLFGWGWLLWLMQWYFDILLWLAAVPIGAI